MLVPMHTSVALQDASRSMQVCNACRYCEGFCAVFPAMERRREFADTDLTYLANLCHGCRACFYACQYAPPHPFNVNLPRTLAELRAETWEAYAWPGFLAGLFRRNGTVVALAIALGIALLLLLTGLLRDPAILYGVHTGPGAFYVVIPAWAMISVAALTFTFSVVALIAGAIRFWRGSRSGPFPRPRAWLRAVSDVATLRYLGGGGGDGCNDRDEGFSQARRWLHHALFYGFALCFASTSVAAFYEHGLGRLSPFPLLSLPVLLGTVGGLGMTVGTAGMLWLKIAADPEPGSPRLLGTDFAFILLILLTAVTGLVLLALRASTAMGTLLAIHLGCVLALFVVMPYSKFVHGVYRGVALLRNAVEQAAAPPR
jgi:citrate/tricarballylate utilization protein